jgi:general nucleoside transport system ATP-binding protein
MTALALDTYRLGKRFGTFAALDDVSLKVRPATVHALLGENGAGKSTLVKCVVGYQRPSTGSLLLDGRETEMASPIVARELGIGMVYQHFTLVPGMTVAENLLLARGHVPAIVDWPKVRQELREFIASTPFSLDLDATPIDLSAGEKQKLEIMKQLLLRPRLLILDEPTSVLTPQEADEVLGLLRERAHSGATTVILITHKFREVAAYADEVSVLRTGHLVGSHRVDEVTSTELAAEMVGEGSADFSRSERAGVTAPLGSTEAAVEAGVVARLQVRGLQADGDRGEPAVRGLDLEVRAGEIFALAGVSGNGQRELLEALVGQRRRVDGTVVVDGVPYRGTRAQNAALKVRSLPEEPLRNACVGAMTVAENIGLRSFDQPPISRGGWISTAQLRRRAREAIAEYGIKTRGEGAEIRSLSGGNVQRAVLAREISDHARVLIVANPTFGLDFAASADIHRRLLAQRGAGCAVLLISEDLDELLALADRIAVISEGRIVYQTGGEGADRRAIAAHMAGHSHPAPADAHG